MSSVHSKRPLWDARGCKTSSLQLAAFLCVKGAECLAVEEIPKRPGRYFFVLRPSSDSERHYMEFESDGQVCVLSYPQKMADLRALIDKAMHWRPMGDR
jgi:hypothetical protein